MHTEQFLGASDPSEVGKLAGVDELPDNVEIDGAIHVVRGQRVMLDADLARLYGVSTKRLNEQVKRNVDRFPADFMFRIDPGEAERLMWSQIATTSPSKRRLDQPPLAFTEHGCLMLANVLHSGRAVEVSVLIVRAFVRVRSALAASAELAARMDELARALERQGGVLAAHDAAISRLLGEIRRLTRFPEAPRREIGFTAPWGDGK